MVEPRLEQAAEEGKGAVVKGRRVLPNGTLDCHPSRHSGEGRNPGEWRRGSEGLAGSTRWHARLPPRDCHSRFAGIDGINHSIPACAGMTEGLESGIRQRKQRDYRNSELPVPSSSSFRRRPESRRGGPDGEKIAGFTGWHARLRPRDCHSRFAGTARLNHWIPACAGMTEGLKSGIRQA